MKIFEREDARFFVEKAIQFSNRFDVFIESRAMMKNHFHFILVQEQDNRGIQQTLYHLQMAFAKYFNKKYKRRGQVFEGRFKAKLIDSDQYYWNVTNYVFQNPYKWSGSVGFSGSELVDPDPLVFQVESLVIRILLWMLGTKKAVDAASKTSAHSVMLSGVVLKISCMKGI